MTVSLGTVAAMRNLRLTAVSGIVRKLASNWLVKRDLIARGPEDCEDRLRRAIATCRQTLVGRVDADTAEAASFTLPQLREWVREKNWRLVKAIDHLIEGGCHIIAAPSAADIAAQRARRSDNG